jgi:hypothetical protein
MPVRRPDVRDGLFAGLHGLDEVGRVIGADLAAVDSFDGSFRQWFGFELFDGRTR